MQRSMAWIFVALFGLGLVAARRFARGDAEAQDTLARHPAKGTTDRAGVTSIRRTRPALGIPPLDGNAWDDLTAVVRGLVPDPTAFDAAGADRPHVPVGADVRARLRGAVRCPCTPPDLFEPFEPGVFAGRFALQVLDDAVGDDLAVGRDDEALDLLAAMAAMTADLERTTRLLPVSVAAATATRIHCRLAQVLGAGTRSDGLRRLGTVLDQLEPLRPRPADVLRVLDVDMRAAIFERARCARGPTSLHDVWGPWPWQGSPRRRTVRALERREARTAVLREIAGTPLPTWRTALASLPESLGTRDPRSPSGCDDRRGGAAYLQHVPRAAAAATVTRVALAVGADAAEQGTLPATLDALVPASLPAVPTCRLTGQPLRYDAASDRVGSIGGDGDDATRPVPVKDGVPDAVAEGGLRLTVAVPAKR